MKKIKETLDAYYTNGVNKATFIREMYDAHHDKLFDYSEHLSNTNIKSITIEDHKVVMTTRDRGIKILGVPGDFRVAPLEILNFFDYEKDDYVMIDRIISDGDRIFDIGANMGWYSINLAMSRRKSQVYCFEPIPSTFKYLQRNINLNGLSNVKAHNFGLSNSSGLIDFYFYGEGSGNASSANLSERDDVNVVCCEMQTLDDFCREADVSVDFIKCDVEGAELFVLQGGIKTIGRDKPIVFAEILRKWAQKFEYNPNEIFYLLQSEGYKVFTVNGDSLIEFSKMDENTIETNFFFLHNVKHARKIAQLSA